MSAYPVYDLSGQSAAEFAAEWDRTDNAAWAEESLRERVAEAVCQVDVGAEFLSEQSPEWQEQYRLYADAAIAAIRQP